MKHAAGVILALAVASVCGCSRNTYHGNGTDRYERGLVVCLSGAGGMMGETGRIRDGLQRGGVDRAIEVFRWSRGGVLQDQTGIEVNRRKARELARRVEGYIRSYPGRPVHLIGVSAGTGLVVWALEDLEPGMQATAGILISSSLDTAYDLTKALQKTEDGIYSFNSMADTVLSLGVTWAGTVDRNGGLAGGLVGFAPPPGASEETKRLYKEKLTEIRWWPGDVVLGHLGDHLGATNPAYVKAKIAPIVLGKEPPKRPRKPPVEAVEAGKDGRQGPASVYTRPEAEKPPGPPADQEPPEAGPAEKKTPSAVEEQAEKARRDLQRRSDGAAGENGRRRFHDWRVRRPDEPVRSTRRPAESIFFRRPERLP